jgi:FixJ family two-component response regulator
MGSPLDEMAKPVVWIIDSQQWPRANLRALLIERGFDAIGFIELHQALATLNEPDYPKPRILVVELHDLSPTEEELERLARLPMPIIALAGALELNQEWIKRVKWAALIQRPMSIGQVADAIEKLVLTPSPPPSPHRGEGRGEGDSL